MPYASKAQAAFMHIHHPSIARRWDAEGAKVKKSDDEMAMHAVVEDMGRAAKSAKAKKYAPRPTPPAMEQSPADSDSGVATPSADDLEKLLSNE